MKERIVVEYREVGKIAGLLGCSREMVSHSLAFRKNSKLGLSGNFWLVSFKISYLCLPLFYETRTTPSCHPSGCAYRQL